MTFEDFEKTIEGMLAVQRDLQESQLRHEGMIASLVGYAQQQQQTLDRQANILDRLLAYSEQQQQILDRLISYTLKNESEHLNLEERLSRLESRNGN